MEELEIFDKIKWINNNIVMIGANGSGKTNLLESIYLGSIPIAPSQLLLQNSLPGMGYNEMQELLEEKNWRADFTDLFKKVYEKYDKEIFMHRLIRCIEG